MKIPYPIKSSYVADWTLVEALRELVANGLDAQTQHSSSFGYSYLGSKRTLTLRNVGVKLPIDALYFGGSEKADKTSLIGKYGEGLKLAMLVIARTPGVRMRVVNGNELWTPAFEKDAKTGMESLVVRIKKTEEESSDFVITVSGVERDVWTKVRDLFLALKDAAVVWQSETGSILPKTEAGNIFVHGVKCATLTEFEYGYNIDADIDTGRDRRIPNMSELRAHVGELLSEWTPEGESPEARSLRIYELLSKGQGEATALQTGSLWHMRNDLKARFLETHGANAVPVTSTQHADDWRFLGKTPVMVTAPLYEGLCYAFDDISAAKANLARSIVEEYKPIDLEDAEARVLVQVETLLKQAQNGELRPFHVVKFHDDELLGLFDKNEVFLRRSVLSSFPKALMVAAHEVAHSAGPDGSLGHVRKMERLLESALATLLSPGGNV